MVAAMALSATLIRRLGFRPLLLGGSGLIVAGLLGFALPPPLGLHPVTWLAVGVVVSGLGNGFAAPTSNNAGLQLAPDDTSAVSGLRGMFRQTGGLIGVALLTSLASVGSDSGRVQAIAHIGLAALLAGTILLMVRIPNHRGTWYDPSPDQCGRALPAAVPDPDRGWQAGSLGVEPVQAARQRRHCQGVGEHGAQPGLRPRGGLRRREGCSGACTAVCVQKCRPAERAPPQHRPRPPVPASRATSRSPASDFGRGNADAGSCRCSPGRHQPGPTASLVHGRYGLVMAQAIEQLRSGLVVGHVGLKSVGAVDSIAKDVHDGDAVAVVADGDFRMRFFGVDAHLLAILQQEAVATPEPTTA